MRLIRTYKHEPLDEQVNRLVKFHIKNGYKQVKAEVSEVCGEYQINIFGHKETQTNPLRYDLINTIKRTKHTTRGVSKALNIPYGTLYHYVRGKNKGDDAYHKLIARIKKYYNLEDFTNNKKNDILTELIGGIQNEGK